MHITAPGAGATQAANLIDKKPACPNKSDSAINHDPRRTSKLVKHANIPHKIFEAPRQDTVMSIPIPQPPGIPLLGNVRDIDPSNTWVSLQKLWEKYGRHHPA